MTSYDVPAMTVGPDAPSPRWSVRGAHAQAQAKPFVVVVLHPAETFVIEVPRLAGEQHVTQRPADRGQEVTIDRAVGQPLLSGGRLFSTHALEPFVMDAWQQGAERV